MIWHGTDVGARAEPYVYSVVRWPQRRRWRVKPCSICVPQCSSLNRARRAPPCEGGALIRSSRWPATAAAATPTACSGLWHLQRAPRRLVPRPPCRSFLIPLLHLRSIQRCFSCWSRRSWGHDGGLSFGLVGELVCELRHSLVSSAARTDVCVYARYVCVCSAASACPRCLPLPLSLPAALAVSPGPWQSHRVG